MEGVSDTFGAALMMFFFGEVRWFRLDGECGGLRRSRRGMGSINGEHKPASFAS